jgi:hypothetical protein
MLIPKKYFVVLWINTKNFFGFRQQRIMRWNRPVQSREIIQFIKRFLKAVMLRVIGIEPHVANERMWALRASMVTPVSGITKHFKAGWLRHE